MTGKARFCVKTKDETRLLNKLRAFSLSDIKRTDSHVSFCADMSDKKQILDILQGSLYNNIECEEITPKTLFLRYVFAVVFASVFFAVAFLPQFVVFRADVSADEDVKKAAESIVSESVSLPSLAKDVDKEELKNKLYAISGVSFCEVSEKLGKIDVFVRGSKSVEPISFGKELKSRCDGVVTKIVVLSGRAKVNVGDEVKEGDVLIEGKIFDEKTSRETETVASGEVYGVSTKETSVFVPKTAILLRETGRKKTVRSICVFGLNIGGEAPFKYYEKSSSKNVLSRGFLIPVTIGKDEYIELVAKTVETDAEYEAALLKDREEKLANERVEKIISHEVFAEEREEGYYITSKLVTERKFC